MTGGKLTGSIVNALGITTTTDVEAVYTTGETLIAKGTATATESTLLGDVIDWDTLSGDLMVIKDSSGQTTKTINVTENSTIGKLLSDLRNEGFEAVMSGGVITITSNSANYITGAVAEALGIDFTTSETSGSGYTSTSIITSTKTYNADGTTLINDIVDLSGLTGTILGVYNSNGDLITTIEVTETDTINSVFGPGGKLSAYDITGSVVDNILTLTSPSGNYIDGSLAEALGMEVKITSSASGNTITSDSPIIYETQDAATGSTLLSELGINNTNNTVVINNSTGAISTFTVAATATVDNFLMMLAGASLNGISGQILDGVIYLNSTNGSYITGALADALRIGTTQGESSTGKSVTSTTQVTKTIVESVTVDGTFTTDISLNEMMDIMEAQAARVESGSLPVAVTRMTQTEATNAGYTWVINAFQLRIALYLNSDICLGGDIDISEYYSNWSMTVNYTGTLDGNGYTIDNLTISSDAENVGLIQSANGATFKNIRMENVSVEGTSASNQTTGALVGDANNTTFENIAVVSGTVKNNATDFGSGYTGGIVGSADNSTITNAYNGASVIGNTDARGAGGGIAGGSSGTISFAYNAGYISNFMYAGGITGDGIVTNAYNTGTVYNTYSSASTGGIIGLTGGDSPSSNLYNEGTINGGYASGIVGQLLNGTLYNVYNAGTIGESSPDDGGAGIVWLFRGGSINYAYNSGDVATAGIVLDWRDGVINNCLNVSNNVQNAIVHWKSLYSNHGTSGITNAYYTNTSSQQIISGTDDVPVEMTAISSTEAQQMLNEGLNATYSNVDTETLTTSSLLSDYGLAENAYVTVWNAGTNVLVTITPEDTVQGMLDKLGQYGITGSVSDGKLTLNGDDTHYIQSMTDSLADVLHLNVGEGYSYIISSCTLNTESDRFISNSTTTISTTSTLREFGLSENAYITVVHDGTTSIVTVTPDKTVNQIFSELNECGITTSLSGGKVSFSGGSGMPITYMSEESASGSSKLSELGVTTANNTIIINNSSGAVSTFTIAATATVNELLNQIANNSGNSITGSISGGIITLSSTDGSYITGSLAELLGIGLNDVRTIGKAATSTMRITYTTSSIATASTALKELGICSSYVAAGSSGFINAVSRLSESEAIAQGYTVIKTAEQLQNIENNLDGKYILMNDIDLSSISNWTPIGKTSGSSSDYESFTGTLDGNGYVIKNLTIEQPDVMYNGLFAHTAGATLKNIGLENVNIHGGRLTGALAGSAYDGTNIDNCWSTGTVSAAGSYGYMNAEYYVGGLLGSAFALDYWDGNTKNIVTDSDIAGAKKIEPKE